MNGYNKLVEMLHPDWAQKQQAPLTSAIRKLEDNTSKQAHLSPAERDAILAVLRVLDADVLGGGGRHANRRTNKR